MGNKIVFKPKGLGYPIPEELEESIGNYIRYLNEDETGRYLD